MIFLEVFKRIQANVSPVCVGAKGNSFGIFTSPVTGAVKTIQMAHISGGVAWSGGSKYEGRWGDKATQLFEIHITNTNNERIAPPINYPMNDNTSLRYSLPGQRFNDTSFSFPEFSPRLMVQTGEEFRVWYGEDLQNYTEEENSGTTCGNVFLEYRDI